MTQTVKIEIRMTQEEKDLIQKRAKDFGFTSVSEFIRVISTKGTLNI